MDLQDNVGSSKGNQASSSMRIPLVVEAGGWASTTGRHYRRGNGTAHVEVQSHENLSLESCEVYSEKWRCLRVYTSSRAMK